jgi:hypothetical protein
MMFTRTRRARDLILGELALGLLIAITGCTHTVKVEPIKVEPIDITLHIYLEADQKLDSFFGDDEPAAAPASPPAPSSSAPTSSPARPQGDLS